MQEFIAFRRLRDKSVGRVELTLFPPEDEHPVLFHKLAIMSELAHERR